MQHTKSILKFQVFSVFFVWILGTLLHFTYEWSNHYIVFASFSAVNESIWEHLKLLFFPMLLTVIIGYFFWNKEVSNFLYAKTLGILLSLSFIILFFYTYSGILGTNLAIIDIASFFVATLIGEYFAYRMMISNSYPFKSIPVFVLLLLLFSFVFFTYFPPKIGLFQDPVTGYYGRTL